jgi:hypothetical protein
MAGAVLVPATAQWVKFASGMSGSSLAGWYYDKAFLRDSGSRKIFWMVKDLTAPDENQRHSYKFLVQMDCQEKKFRLIQVAGFKEPMAVGEQMGVDSSLGRWQRLGSDTLFAHVQGLVCLPPSASENGS